MSNRIDSQIDDMFKLLDEFEKHQAEKQDTPYPWCHGSPTREACAARGFCDRDPNCGE